MTRTLQRLVMPVDRDLDVLSLYGSTVSNDSDPALGAAHSWSVGATGSTSAVDRGTAVVPPGKRVTFCTYFNAFPAGYWRRWSVVDEVVLRVRVSGDAVVIVYRSSSKGHAQRVTSVEIDSDTAEQHEFTLSLEPFIDGGWYWFEIVAGERDAVLERAEWCADTDRAQGTATIGITTFNRPKFCVEQLLALGAAPEVLEVIDQVLVVDQGTKRVEDHPDFEAAALALGDKLRVIDQANLGGSGGFARSMDETVRAGRSDYVLLLDDDVVTEPEGILRAITFGDLTRTPTIVGGHMFNLFDRSVLHTYGEGVERYRWFYRPAPHTIYGHNFAHAGLRETAWLHRRVDVDYNAWWMCLIPTDVIKKIGLALPLFIKWDDAEYGIRAGRAGIPTVSLPGAAVWHVPWHDKDDTLDWQAYFHERNRIVAALLHSPYDRGGNLVKESLLIATKHALSMQYSTAELMLKAIDDIFAGPGHLHAGIAGIMGDIRGVRAEFADAQAKGDLDEFPPVRRRKPPRKGKEATSPDGRRAMVMTAITGGAKQFKAVSALARRSPEASVPHVDQRWWVLSQLDSALVSSADGTKVAWYQRDPARFRSLLGRITVQHARLLREWPKLSREYQAALPGLVSAESWRETFQADTGRDPATGA